MTPMVMPLVFAAVAALAGLLMFFGDDPDEARLKEAPLRQGDQLVEGERARLVGQIKATQLLTSPHGVPCVYLRIVAYAQHSRTAGKRGAIELWSQRLWSDDLSLSDGYARVFLDLTHAEVRPTNRKILNFSVLSDRDQLPGELARELPPETREQMSELHIETIEPAVNATAAGKVEKHAGLLTLGGTDMVFSTEGDEGRADRKRAHQLTGIALFVLSAVLVVLAFTARTR